MRLFFLRWGAIEGNYNASRCVTIIYLNIIAIQDLFESI